LNIIFIFIFIFSGDRRGGPASRSVSPVATL